MKTENKIKQAYEKIMKIIKENDLFIDVDYVEKTLNNHLLLLELEQKTKMKLDRYKFGYSKYEFNKHVYLTKITKNTYRNAYKSTFFEEEMVGKWLLRVSFPTGAYILTSSSMFDTVHLKDIFLEFFNGFKQFEPIEIDGVNKELWFTLDKTKEVLNYYESALGEAMRKAKIRELQMKKERLEKELEKLSGATGERK